MTAEPGTPAAQPAERGVTGAGGLGPFTPSPAATYPSRLAFFEADGRRAWSPTVQFGWWRDEHGRGICLEWLERTGELVLFPAGRPDVEVLGVVRDEYLVRVLLAGWEYACPRADGLTWLRRRLAPRGGG